MTDDKKEKFSSIVSRYTENHIGSLSTKRRVTAKVDEFWDVRQSKYETTLTQTFAKKLNPRTYDEKNNQRNFQKFNSDF